MLTLCTSVAEFRNACDALRAATERVALVPTMGALHSGHLALIERAKQHATAVAVSIFVNPTQFGPGEDFDRYPRNLDRDLELCTKAGARLVFSPPRAEMYVDGEQTRVYVKELTEHLCGPRRPGHFEGVATIVAKLFAAAGPCVAVFGRKDYQQLKVVTRMARDLCLPVEIVGHPTQREPDGLALSSRNAYLSPELRANARAIPRVLARAAWAFEAGERRRDALIQPARDELARAGLRVDYVDLADPEHLAPFSAGAPLPERALLALAVFAGTTRLIDNLVLGEERAPLTQAESNA